MSCAGPERWCSSSQRVFNLLAYLVQHPGRTVTKEELREQLWPHQPFMSDDPLTNCVAHARQSHW